MRPEESPYPVEPPAEPAPAPGRLPFDHDEPTPAAVIAAAQAAQLPLTEQQPTAAQASPYAPPGPAIPRQFTGPGQPPDGYPQPWTVIGSGGYPQLIPLPPAPLTLLEPAPPRRRWGRLIAIIAIVLAVCCAVSVAAVVFGLPYLRSALPADPSASATPARSPEAGDPQSVAQAWMRERIAEQLAKRAEALVAGDEAAYLAVAAEADKSVRDQLRRQYRSLRAMKIASWQDEFLQPITFKPVTPHGETWRADLISNPCFVTAPCEKAVASSITEWKMHDGAAALVSWELGKAGRTPHPWQVTALKAKSGARTVVATTAKYASKLPTLLKQAEKAALVADRFARAGKTPSRYVIYYAGPSDWHKWFNWKPPDWSAGVAIRVSADRYELVLNAKVLTEYGVDDLLRHELTHASTLPGRYRESQDLWWLVEGVAELAEMEGIPVRKYAGLEYVTDLLKSGDVDDLSVDPPKASTDERIVGGRYGVAFLAVRCIAERYGEEQLVKLFHRVVHDGVELAVATPEVLDTEWSSLRAECLEYIKQVAS